MKRGRKEKPALSWQAPRTGENGNREVYNTADGLCQYHRAEVLANGGYVVIPEAILHDPSLTAPEKLTWIALAAHQRGDDLSWPSVTRLARLTRLSRRTVIRALKSLERKGYLKKKKRHGTTSLYQLFYRPELNHSQSSVTMAPLSQKAGPEHNHSESGATVALGWCQNGTGVVPLCHPETEAVNKRQEKEKNKCDASASLVSESQKSENLPTNGNGQDLEEIAADLLAELNYHADRDWPENPVTLAPIIARLREGFTYHQLRGAILHCVGLWKGTPYETNLRPKVICGPKLPEYVGESERIALLSALEEEAGTEMYQLQETGLRRKAEGASEDELQELRAAYLEARERWSQRHREFWRYLETHYPRAFANRKNVDSDWPWS